MKVTKVCCQGCGADLEVDESIRFVTCNYCNARLEVVHDPTVTHTRQLDKIEKTTDRMANNLKVIEIQNDLERLDREWDLRRQGLMVRNRRGGVAEPSATGAVFAGAIVVVFGIIWISMAVKMGAPDIFPLFGVVFIFATVFGLIRSLSKADNYRGEQKTYEDRRTKMVSDLDRERGSR